MHTTTMERIKYKWEETNLKMVVPRVEKHLFLLSSSDVSAIDFFTTLSKTSSKCKRSHITISLYYGMVVPELYRYSRIAILKLDFSYSIKDFFLFWNNYSRSVYVFQNSYSGIRFFLFWNNYSKKEFFLFQNTYTLMAYIFPIP